MMTVLTKRCCHCKKKLSLDEFGRNRSNPDGLSDQCRECTHWFNTRILSLDKPRKSLHGRTLGEMLSAPVKTADTSYEKVFRALGVWMKSKIITKKEAEAIYLHAVEEFSFAQIGKMVECHTQTVFGAYQRGINKLRNAFAGLAEEALSIIHYDDEEMIA